MNVRLATTDDDAGIAALMENIPLPGSMQLAFGCRPSFFQALRVGGTAPIVAVAEDGGEIVGVGAVTFRKVYLNGNLATLRYLSALRVAPHARGSSAMARGFACLRTELAKQPAAVTLTSILADNTTALRILTKKRPAAPAYEPLCECVTRVVPARHPCTDSLSNKYVITAAGADEIAAFIGRHGPARNFFPVCHAEDLGGSANSAFPGLAASDFVVARDGGEIVGVLGCWNVMRFRQAMVTGYGTPLRWVRPWLNLGARWLGRPLLPAPGQAVRLAYGALALVKDAEPEVFRLLLKAARERTRRQGLDYFVVALAAGDPLAKAFRGLPCRELRSRIFRVHFEPPTRSTLPDARTPHFEGAML